MKHGQCSVNPP